MRACFKIIWILAIPLTLASCFSSDLPEIPNQTLFRSNLQGIGENVTGNGDTLRILSVRIVFEELVLTRSNSSFSLEDGQIIAFHNALTINQNINLVIKEFPGGVYTGAGFSIALPKDDDIDNPHASVFITGLLGPNPFQFVTGLTFSRTFNFESLAEIPETGGSITVTILSNAADWFRSGENVLNPDSSGDRDKINQNIQSSFSIQSVIFPTP